MIEEITRDAYPDTLKNMKYPPRKLFFRGTFPAPKDQKYLCVVGSRMWTPYGRDSVRRILNGLSGYPITIVSGLAVGIDSIAHIAALEAGLHCVAFPGSSLEWDSIYPHVHVALARKIVDNGGALISQWRSGYETGKWAFPARNRLMAGLSHATLIVEAGQRSGSLMTAKHAEDFNRDVFAIPGPITAQLSYGPHMLIRRGAALVSSAEDVLGELGFKVSKKPMTSAYKLAKLDPLSAAIMKIVLREEVNLDELLQKTHASVQSINEKVSTLELAGFVKVEEGILKII